MTGKLVLMCKICGVPPLILEAQGQIKQRGQEALLYAGATSSWILDYVDI